LKDDLLHESRNGTGKSTLLRAISSREISIPSFLHVVHVMQESEKLDTPALDSVLQADSEREWLLARERSMVDNEIDEEEGVTLQEVYERLEELESDNAEHRAATILSGLGFNREMMQTRTKNFSGGWRMRISLAQALFLRPDLLLLDEPSAHSLLPTYCSRLAYNLSMLVTHKCMLARKANHLDVHALTWLEEFLRK
jgi:ATP-binding cassette subfamily F protein 2